MNSSNNIIIIMSDNVIILKNCSVGLRSWCNTYCLQPYTALFVFVFMAATLHSSFYKSFYYNLFPSIFKNYMVQCNYIVLHCNNYLEDRQKVGG